MATPVVLSPNAANRIRSAVSAVSMMSRPYGVVGSGGRAPAKGEPMPLDLSVYQDTSGGVATPHAYVRLAGLYVVNGGDDIPTDTTAPQSLRNAIYSGSTYWDAGVLTAADPTMGFCLYVLKRVFTSTAHPEPHAELRWGIATGSTVAGAVAAVPAASGSGTTSGDNIGTHVLLPLGAVSIDPQSKPVLQLWHGVVAVPRAEEVTVVSDFQYDYASKQLQVKRRAVLASPTIPETAWTMATGGQAEVYP